MSDPFLKIQRQIQALQEQLERLRKADVPVPGGGGGGGYTEGARVYNSTPITTTTATLTVMTFDSERYDTDGIHSTVTNPSRLTCQTTGKYAISGQIRWDTSAVGDRYVDILLNGTTIIASIRPDTVENADASITTIYSLIQSDYVELRTYQTTGGNLNVRSDGNYSPEFMMQRVG